jgi:hypothetical protein
MFKEQKGILAGPTKLTGAPLEATLSAPAYNLMIILILSSCL